MILSMLNSPRYVGTQTQGVNNASSTNRLEGINISKRSSFRYAYLINWLSDSTTTVGVSANGNITKAWTDITWPNGTTKQHKVTIGGNLAAISGIFLNQNTSAQNIVDYSRIALFSSIRQITILTSGAGLLKNIQNLRSLDVLTIGQYAVGGIALPTQAIADFDMSKMKKLLNIQAIGSVNIQFTNTFSIPDSINVFNFSKVDSVFQSINNIIADDTSNGKTIGNGVTNFSVPTN